MKDLENHYVTRLQGIQRPLESGETVTWKVLDRTHLLLMRLPERKQLKGEAAPQPAVRKRARRTREQRP